MNTIRVLVVDDSVVVRRMVTSLLEADPEIEVVGTAVNGAVAQTKFEQLRPDLVTMDIEMPVMDGIEAVRRIRASGSRVPIIMFSTLTERGAIATLDALAAGATDYVTKPTNAMSIADSAQQVRDALVPRIKSLVPVERPAAAPRPRATGAGAPVRPATPPTRLRPPAAVPAGGHRILVIGSSTGGPEALTTLLSTLPVLPVPVAVVQHMPPVFTKQLAARLDRRVDSTVSEVEDGDVLRPGSIGFAPGDFHMLVRQRDNQVVARLSQAPAENYCRPAVDVLFRSAAEAFGNRVLALVLTGMGHDGRAGAGTIVEAGGSVLAQDEATSVVWGMPGAVTQAGLVESVLPLSSIGPELVRRLAGDQATAGRAPVGVRR